MRGRAGGYRVLPGPGWSRGGSDTAGKVVATAATLAAWAAVASLGIFGTFADGTSGVATSLDDGVLSLGLGDGAPPGLPLTFADLVPGGTLTRALTLVNDGGVTLSAVVVSTDATASSLLDTDPVDGLQLTVESCSVAWTADLACPGTRSTQVPPGPVVRQAPLVDPASRAVGGRDHLAVTVALPATAGNEFAGRSSALVLTFTGLQRAGVPS